MARLASPFALALIVCVAGCATTQQEAARLRLNSARLRQGQLATRVPRADPQVRVRAITLLRDAGQGAVVVTVTNMGRRPVSDLPVLTGYRLRGRVVYLNAGAGLDYFQSHLPAIPAHAALRWVLTTGRLPARARLFAVVGPAALPAAVPERLPRILVRTAGRSARGQLRLRLVNTSGIPQYQLQVYAVATRGTRLIGAGRASIAELASGAIETVNLRLVGAAGAHLAVSAPPTIFS